MSLKSGGADLSHNVNLKDLIFHWRDGKMNETLELALLHGVYTGIVCVTLWNIFIGKSRVIGRAMVAVIILLYITTTINFSLNWEMVSFGLEGKDFDLAEEYLGFVEGRLEFVDLTKVGMLNIGIGITATMSTVVADSTMIWRCWMVWGRRWLIVVCPILCLVTGFVFKILEITEAYLHQVERVSYLMVYLSCILATTLWCTVLIVLRILFVIRINSGANGGLGEYRHVIEVLVESSALHSVTLIVFVALEARSDFASDYFNVLVAITTGVAPTLLAGRVAAGHARPDDSWESSIISSLRFETHPQADAETCSQEGSLVDLEAQSEQVDESKEIGAEKRI